MNRRVGSSSSGIVTQANGRAHHGAEAPSPGTTTRTDEDELFAQAAHIAELEVEKRKHEERWVEAMAEAKENKRKAAMERKEQLKLLKSARDAVRRREEQVDAEKAKSEAKDKEIEELKSRMRSMREELRRRAQNNTEGGGREAEDLVRLRARRSDIMGGYMNLTLEPEGRRDETPRTGYTERWRAYEGDRRRKDPREMFIDSRGASGPSRSRDGYRRNTRDREMDELWGVGKMGKVVWHRDPKSGKQGCFFKCGGDLIAAKLGIKGVSLCKGGECTRRAREIGERMGIKPEQLKWVNGEVIYESLDLGEMNTLRIPSADFVTIRDWLKKGKGWGEPYDPEVDTRPEVDHTMNYRAIRKDMPEYIDGKFIQYIRSGGPCGFRLPFKTVEIEGNYKMSQNGLVKTREKFEEELRKGYVGLRN
eukprot:g5393.t1